MIGILDTKNEFTVYELDDIKITGIIEDKDLWLFIGPVTRWSVSRAKQWLVAISDICEAAEDKDIYRLMCYVTTPESQKFAEFLGFTEQGNIGEAIIMSQNV